MENSIINKDISVELSPRVRKVMDKAQASLKRCIDIQRRLDEDITVKEETILLKSLNRHQSIVSNALLQKRKFSRNIVDYGQST